MNDIANWNVVKFDAFVIASLKSISYLCFQVREHANFLQGNAHLFFCPLASIVSGCLEQFRSILGSSNDS